MVRFPVFAFCFATIATLFFPTLCPWCRIAFYIPFVVTVCYRNTLAASLWVAILCGTILDLFLSHHHLGIYATGYAVTTTLLHRYKGLLFEEKAFALPLMTFLFSVTTTLLLAIFLKVTDDHLILSWQWAMSDVVIVPCCDALWSVLAFVIPRHLLGAPLPQEEPTPES